MCLAIIKLIIFQAIAVNDPPSIRFLSTDHTRSANYQLDAEVTPVHARQRIDSGECILANAADDLESYPLTIVGERVLCRPVLPREGEYLIRLRLCDSKFSSDICARQAKRVVFDKTPPAIVPTDPNAVHSGNVSLRFRISEYSESANRIARLDCHRQRRNRLPARQCPLPGPTTNTRSFLIPRALVPVIRISLSESPTASAMRVCTKRHFCV